MRTLPLLLATLVAVPVARADSPERLLADYRARAAAAAPAYPGPSARSGAEFFQARGTDWSCASCHTADPRRRGRHAVTGKPIEPLAPSAHAQRFTDRAKVEKWFRRNLFKSKVE